MAPADVTAINSHAKIGGLAVHLVHFHFSLRYTEMRQLDLDCEISTPQISADEKKVLVPPQRVVVVALLAAKLDAGKSGSAESGFVRKDLQI